MLITIGPLSTKFGLYHIDDYYTKTFPVESFIALVIIDSYNDISCLGRIQNIVVFTHIPHVFLIVYKIPYAAGNLTYI